MERDICTCTTIWLSLSLLLSSLLSASPPTQHQNPISNQTRRGEEQRKAVREKKGATKESKHLGNGVLYIHPQEKGVGRLFGLLLVPGNEEGRRKGRGHKPQKPPFLVFYCHLIQFIALCSSDHFPLSSYPLIFVFPFCKLPSSSECYCA